MSQRQLKSKIYCFGHDMYSSPVCSFYLRCVEVVKVTATLDLSAEVDSDMTHHFLQT